MPPRLLTIAMRFLVRQPERPRVRTLSPISPPRILRIRTRRLRRAVLDSGQPQLPTAVIKSRQTPRFTPSWILRSRPRQQNQVTDSPRPSRNRFAEQAARSLFPQARALKVKWLKQKRGRL